MSQHPKTTTRREMFASAATAAVASAVVVPTFPHALLAMPGPDHPDAALFGYRPRLDALYQLWGHAIDAQDKREKVMFAERELLGPVPDDFKGKQAWQTAWDAHRAKHKAEGLQELRDAAQEQSENWRRLASEMLDVRARTFDGIKFKIEVTLNHINDEELLDAIAADVASVAGPMTLWSQMPEELEA
jgi:hypothetical protein